MVRGRYVVCKVSASGQVVVIRDGAVFQRDGTIVEVGDFETLRSKHVPDEVLGSPDHVVIPGLVNAHHHVGLTPFQLGSPDYPLEMWIASRISARDVDPYLDTLYSAFQMLESGVTTVHHLHGQRRGPWQRWPLLANRVLDAYRDIGMRVNYTFSFRDQNRLVYGPDDEFVEQLPHEIRADVSEMLRGQAIPIDSYLSEIFESLRDSWGHNAAQRTRVELAPLNLHWCSDDALVQLAERASEARVGMHIHLLETAYQKEYARRRTGGSAARHLYDLGLLGPRTTIGHGVWLTSEDIAVLAETGTTVCHNASSNLRLRSGTAPVNALLAAGVRVALGIDEAGINDDRDMFQEMRLVWNLHRTPGLDQVVPTAGQVLQMATEHGAATTHYGNQIGTLEAGSAADLLLLDWRVVSQPYLDETVPPADAIVQRATPRAVDIAMVAGDVILRGGRSTRLNKNDVLREIADQLGAPLRPEELRRQEVASQLLPFVRRFYEGWIDVEEFEPFHRINSRT